MRKYYYIAYGSNLNINQMKYRCPTARVVGTAYLKDYQLLFKGSKSGSYLTIESKVDSVVPVGVWSVTDEDILSLDRYEGYPSFYYKKEMDVEVVGIKSGRLYRKKCFVYIMHEDRPLGIPSKSYVSTCLEGYKAFRFNNLYLAEALKISMEER
jgi:hypothetical protein